MDQSRHWPLSAWSDAGLLAALIDPDTVPEAAHGVAPAQWFAMLREQGRVFEATTFLAHALPRYECVVWAARTLIESGALVRSDPLVGATLRWIDDPSDHLRRAAGEAADRSGRARAGELLCQAVFYSGGSIAPEDLAAVNAPPQTCARMAAGAVLTGAYDHATPAAVLERGFEIGDTLARQQR